jgi:cell wall-associated NlpC family hydrolase
MKPCCLRIGVCLLLVALFCAAFWRESERFEASQNFPPEGLQEGDLIFRIGTHWRSEAVRSAGHMKDEKAQDPDPYSHVGFLVGSSKHWQVLHSTPAEKAGRSDGVVLDDLAFFAAPERARGIALYRVAADADERAAAVRFARSRLGTPFQLVDNDTEGNYCTTFVWRAWREAGVDLGARFERIRVFFDSAHYLFPPALRRSPLLKLMYESPASLTPSETSPP